MFITPNDLLLDGREFDDYKKEVFEELDSPVIDMVDTMKIVEADRAKAQNGDEKEER
ncbi:hypothetical protein [Lysinibacillus fusiformis]|uniref:hypothetical protein n=1 Tax=Lysinibacillus fusiformis TaxID=28031 RepID=UPI000A8CF251|nr:hypothetical protein [Lysinibacillus fusiformis]